MQRKSPKRPVPTNDKNAQPANLVLLRGRTYTMVHPFDRRRGSYVFQKGIPYPVNDPQVVEYARTLREAVVDGDGGEIKKPMFRIEEYNPGTDDDDEDEEVLEAPARRGRPVTSPRRRAAT